MLVPGVIPVVHVISHILFPFSYYFLSVILFVTLIYFLSVIFLSVLLFVIFCLSFILFVGHPRDFAPEYYDNGLFTKRYNNTKQYISINK